MDEIDKTGKPMMVTKRGVPVMKVVPIREAKAVEIVGDPDDLMQPVFPPENYDMLK